MCHCLIVGQAGTPCKAVVIGIGYGEIVRNEGTLVQVNLGVGTIKIDNGIRRFACQAATVFEGVGEVRHLGVMVEQPHRYGLQGSTSVEGIVEHRHLGTIVEEPFG